LEGVKEESRDMKIITPQSFSVCQLVYTIGIIVYRNQFLHALYLKAHDIICQIYDLENKIMNPQCRYLTKKVRSVSVAIIGRLEKLLQFS
jgi:hypothetical protein